MSRKKSALLLAASTTVGRLVLEAALHVLTMSGLVDIRRPTYTFSRSRPLFWAEVSPEFGVWHEANAVYRHVASCYDVTYTANSAGARDGEWREHSGGKRVVALGDSFVEGVGVAYGERLTELLEGETGMEVLNFGIAGHAGPVQHYLIYREIASRFDHDVVLVGILPDNDFHDMDFEYGKTVYRNRYRPYFVGEYPDYRLEYFRKDFELPAPRRAARSLASFLREISYTYNAFSAVRNRRAVRDKRGAKREGRYSGYYDFKDYQFDLLRYSLERLAAEARGKAVVVFTIPRLADLKRFDAEGEAPLSRRMEEFSRSSGIGYVDLLPLMHAEEEDWETYFLPCDGHWNEHGHRTAARLLRDEVPQLR